MILCFSAIYESKVMTKQKQDKKFEIPIHDLNETAPEGREASSVQEQPSAEENDWHAAYLRLAADFNNYKRRVEKDYAEMEERVRARVLKSLLPVYDDFLRLVEGGGASDEGIQAVLKNWQRWLDSQGIHQMDAVGGEFDHHYHEAVMELPVADRDQDGKVVQVFENGYLLGESVLRHAKVAVGRYQGPQNGRQSYESVEEKGDDET